VRTLKEGVAVFERLCDWVQGEMERLGVPGVAVGVYADGREEARGFGVTNVDHPLPVDADTLFQVGSISKTFTATALVRLAEMGKLDLEAPVRTYLPELRLADEAVAARVTTRHLLTHTAGWFGDSFGEVDRGEDALAGYVAEMHRLEQLTPPGELYSYCNSGFYLAGRVIEVVVGKPFEAAMAELVLEPLGLKRSFYLPEDVMVHRFAVGHGKRDGKMTVLTPWALPRAAHAAGGIVASVPEQLTYARFQMGDGRAEDGRRVLSAESLRRLHTPLAPAGGHPDARIALGWHARDYPDGTRLIGHGGGTNGQITTLAVVPARGFALSILTNAGEGGEITFRGQRKALELYLGLEERDPEPLTVDASALAEYAGRYVGSLADVEVAGEGGGLVLRVTPKPGFPLKDSPAPPAPPPRRIAPCDGDGLVILEEPNKGGRIDVIRGADGRIGGLRVGGRIRRRES
jgi:CubicO group peptidase (beta-lactamase class C family)